LRASRRLVGAGAALGLKWPNDLLLDGRKLAGVLAQRCPTHDVVVVGLGLNVGWAPEGAASLAQVTSRGSESHPADLLCAVLHELDALDELDLMAEYRRNLHTLDQDVRVELPDGSVLLGRAVDIDELGRLVVEASGVDTSSTWVTSFTFARGDALRR
jgi:BirA family transcriptional regulator, biotin operon repressor / biotin---[acetyl-CoA-carboxylase] ligase